MTTRPDDVSGSSLPRRRGQTQGTPCDPYCRGAFVLRGRGPGCRDQSRLGALQAKGQRAQAGAVEDLLGSGMELGEVTELLGISRRDLHSLCATRPQRPTEAGGLMNGSVQSKRNARTWRAEPGLHGRVLGEYGRLCSRQS